ncbi:MAG: response regulator [Elusimicrobia bacterium]|nr:response regulator [Elusimicrobiota bacterium]
MNTLAAQSKRIVVVDDNQEVLKTMKRILLQREYDVTTYENPRKALEEYSQNQTDLILTDLKMPEMNGIDLLIQVKKKSPSLPVIIMTAFATIDTAVLATKWGAFNYIKKPFEISRIYDLIDQALTPVVS